MHNIGIILTGKNKTRPTHIGSKLIDLVVLAIHRTIAYIDIAQVANHKVIGFCLSEFRILQVDTFHPIALFSEALHHVATDKSTGATD